MIYNEIKHVLPYFCFPGRYVEAEELHSGNINLTYHIFFEQQDGSYREYVLQRINGYAFHNPRAVMANIEKVTDFLRAKYQAAGESCDRRMLDLVHTTQGDCMFRDEGGYFWRAYRYIDHAKAYNRVEKPEHFREAGRAFGAFQKQLLDFPASELEETIPDFHNTPKRFYQFVASVAADRSGRVNHVEDEIEFMFDHRRMMAEIVKRLERGELPLRVTHNDTKINNVMIDDATGKAICVIDLDTVMPGSSLYDFGDAIRYGANTGAEDEKDLTKVSLDMNLFREFTGGFLSQVRGCLDDDEIRLLPLGVKVITCELAMRFLTDYIDGDLYFKVNSPEHNLVRARAQMRLLEDIEAKYGEMNGIIEEMMREPMAAEEEKK